jgi:hypothetical protein
MTNSNKPDFLFVFKAIIASIVDWFFRLDIVLKSILFAILVVFIVNAVNPNALVAVIIISVIVIIFVAYFKEKDVQAQLDDKYFFAKERLMEDPYDNRLRDLALQAGRKYYASLRGGILTIYDEQAIANDLASITPILPQPDEIRNNKSSIVNNDDVVTKLQKLVELKDSGLISNIEFEAKRQKILDQI